jgi:Fic family protein
MSDPLSKYIDLGQEKGDFSAKIFCEIGIFGEMQNLRVGNDVKDILKAAELIQSRLGTSHPGIRSGSIGTVSDGRGMSYHFPPISEGLKFLDKNKLCFREIAHSFPMIAAIVATSYFLAVHPFRDGNGRTFRIILNILFSVAADAKRYLPVSAVAAASNGGHLIKLKRALYQQEWLPLFQQFEHYYDAVIALAHDWGEKPHKTSQSPAKS